MKRALTLLLCAVLLASCAAPPVMNNPGYNPGYSSHAEYMAANGIVPPEYTPPPKVLLDEHGKPWREGAGNASNLRVSDPPKSTGPSGWDVLGAAILLPLLLPVAMIANYPGPGVHCRSYTYKDQYHVKCY